MPTDEYQIDSIHYRDEFGALLWQAPMIFRRLHGIGEFLLHEGKSYSVLRVAVAENVQHVNLAEGSVIPREPGTSADMASPPRREIA